MIVSQQNCLVHNQQNALMFKVKNDRTQISFFWAIVILLNAAVSTDPFYMGYAFQCGIIQAFVICLFVIVLTMTSFHLYIRSWVYEKRYSYKAIWASIYGQKTSFIPSMFILIAYFSIAVICTNEAYLDLIEIFESVSSVRPAILDNKWIMVYLTTFAISLPFVFQKQASGFRYAAGLGKFGLVFSCGVLVYRAVIKIMSEGIDPSHKLTFWNNKWDLALDTFGLFNTVLFIHPMIQLVAQDLENPTESRTIKLTWSSTIVTAFICLITGYSSYFTHYDDNQGDNVLYYLPKKELLTILAKIGGFISNMILCAFYVWMLAREFCQLLHVGSENSIQTRAFSGILVLCFNAGMNFINPVVVEVFRLMGNLCFIMLAFVLPSLFYLKSYWFMSKSWSITAIILLVVAIPCSTTLFIYQVQSL